MIPSARSTIPPVGITILSWKLFGEILKSVDWRKYVRTYNLCENSDHYWPLLWVGLVDQFNFNDNDMAFL